jgi:CelD/BcsL family acetyltransferase involved in cellulose biosynthesis
MTGTRTIGKLMPDIKSMLRSDIDENITSAVASTSRRSLLARDTASDESTMLISDAASLARLRSAWEAMESSANGPIEHYEWSLACVEALASLGRLRTLALFDGDQCCAIAPLVARHSFRVESIGAWELTEPMDLIYADRDALSRLCRELARQQLPIDLPRVRADSPTAEQLRLAFKGRGFVHVTGAGHCPYLEIDSSWKEPESHFNAGRRSDFRRALRNAEKFGTVSFEVVAPQTAAFDALLTEAFDAELKSWKGRDGTAVVLDPLRAPFYRRYLRACCEKGILRLAFMRIDGKAIGMQIAVETKQRLWLHKIGHDETFSRASPGSLLMLHVAKYAAERDFRSIEFLGYVEPWTRMWTERVRECVRVRAYPYGFAGLIAFSADAARAARARLIRSFKRAKG